MIKTTIPTGGLADSAVTTAKITDGTIATADIADSAVTAAKTSGVSGLAEADQWRLTADFSSDSTDPIASNWERNDTTFDKVGTGLSESSGVFTFPSTGIYFIEFTSNYMINGQTGYSNVFVKLTTDNSSYNTVANSSSAIGNLSTDSYLSLSTGVTVDITNVSTHKVRFGVGGQASVLWRGDSGRNETFVTFLKLGAT